MIDDKSCDSCDKLAEELMAIDRDWKEYDDLLLAFLQARRADMQKLCQAIEELPASEQQTKVSIIASDLGFLFQQRIQKLKHIRALEAADHDNN
jgi:hypothetical protein